MSLDYNDNRAKSGPALKKKKSSVSGTGQRKNGKVKEGKTEDAKQNGNVKSQKAGVKRSKGEVRTENRKHSGKQRRKDKKEDIIFTTIFVAAICVFVISLFQLTMMLVPYYVGGQEYDDIKKLAITVDKEEDGEEKDVFKVDFDILMAENPDTVAWLRFEEPAVINYPVVKSADNAEYLTRTFSANDNKLGAIFMDKRCNSSFTDRNTIIYGHNMKMGGEMFSQLNEYASEEFCKSHPYFYIYTPDGQVRTYQVFSAAVVKDVAENYELTYATEEEYLNYLQMCKNTSNYQVDVNLDAASKIVSLSTCTNVNDDERFLLQGVLISEEDNQ